MPFSKDKSFPETMRFTPAAREQGKSGNELGPPSPDARQRIIGKSAALREIEEEVGIFPKPDELVDMTKLAVEGHKVSENIQDAMYPSPGGCDEFISIFLWEKELDRLDIENLKDRLMGDRAAAERITVRLLEYEKLVAVEH